MLTLRSLLLLLVFSLPLAAQDKIKLEGKKEATVGYMSKIKIVDFPGDDPQIKCFPANDDWFAGTDFAGNKTVIFVPGLKSLKATEESKLFTFVFASSKDKKTLLETFEITVTRDGEVVPPPPGGGTPPPKDPPPVPTGKFLFMIVRPDGANASPEYTKVIQLEAWDTLRTAGHKISEESHKDAVALGAKIPDGTILPTIIKLKEVANGAIQVGKPIPFPTNSEGILLLPKQENK